MGFISITSFKIFFITAINIAITFKEVGDIFKLWNVIFPVTTVFNQQWEDVIMLFTGVCGVQFGELLENHAPSSDLLFGIVYVGERLAMLVIVGDIGEVLPTSTVSRICEARVVRVQFCAVRKDLVRKSVQITDTTWEPRYSICRNETKGYYSF